MASYSFVMISTWIIGCLYMRYMSKVWGLQIYISLYKANESKKQTDMILDNLEEAILTKDSI